jgi:hypothetical protein
MAWDRLARAFEDVGFSTRCPLPEAHQPNPSTTAPVLIATKGEMRITLHGYAINQMLFELIDPKVFVAGVLEAAEGRAIGTVSRGALTFSNEKAVWK